MPAVAKPTPVPPLIRGAARTNDRRTFSRFSSSFAEASAGSSPTGGPDLARPIRRWRTASGRLTTAHPLSGVPVHRLSKRRHMSTPCSSHTSDFQDLASVNVSWLTAHPDADSLSEPMKAILLPALSDRIPYFE